MNKINIFLAKYGLIIFFISILTFTSTLESINYPIWILILFPIYVIAGTIYLGNNNVDYIYYKINKKDFVFLEKAEVKKDGE